MEDILASIKKVIAEEKELRVTAGPAAPAQPEAAEEDVLELEELLAPPMDLGPPLLDQDAADNSRQSIETLAAVAAAAPPPPTVNPLEEVVREMLRPILKQWLDEHLPKVVDEHVRREITRITGRPLS
ncbi:MAG TPA: DUF2497 domain-containing protein [Sphingomicrobium sp.]